MALFLVTASGILPISQSQVFAATFDDKKKDDKKKDPPGPPPVRDKDKGSKNGDSGDRGKKDKKPDS